MTLIEDRPTTATSATVVAPLLPLVGADLAVPVLGGGSVRYVNLDCAATAPALQAVADAVAAALPVYASVHRGAGLPSQASTARYEAARAAVGRFVGARQDDVVVFIRNTTDALNLLAAAVPEGGEVLCPRRRAPREPAAVGARSRTASYRCADSLAGTLTALRNALANGPRALLAVTGASNVTGEVLPLGALVAHRARRRRPRRRRCRAARAAPRASTCARCGADYVALSGHKLYAPFGTGVLVGRRDWLDAAAPYLAGGGAVRDVAARTAPIGCPRPSATRPARRTCSAPSRSRRPARRSVRADPQARSRRTRTRCGRDCSPASPSSTASGALASVGGAPRRSASSRSRSTAARPGHVGAYLSAEHGIGVRDGRFCAHPLLPRLGLPGGRAARELRRRLAPRGRRPPARRAGAAARRAREGDLSGDRRALGARRR